MDSDIAFEDGASLAAGIVEVEGDVKGIGIYGDETEFALVKDPTAGQIEETRKRRWFGSNGGGFGDADVMGKFDGGVVGGKNEFCGREICKGGGEFVGAGVDGVPESSDGAEALLGVEFRLPILGG